MKNEILADVWKNRDEFAKKHDYDLDKMVSVLRDLEQNAPNQVVDRRKRIPKQ